MWGPAWLPLNRFWNLDTLTFYVATFDLNNSNPCLMSFPTPSGCRRVWLSNTWISALDYRNFGCVILSSYYHTKNVSHFVFRHHITKHLTDVQSWHFNALKCCRSSCRTVCSINAKMLRQTHFDIHNIFIYKMCRLCLIVYKTTNAMLCGIFLNLHRKSSKRLLECLLNMKFI